MWWMLVSVFLGFLAWAQGDFYARPRQNEPYTPIYVRQAPGGGGSSPSPSPSFPSSPSPPGGEGSPSLPPLFAPETPMASPTGKDLGLGPALPPGLFFRGKLLTGVVASPGLTSPVLVEAEEGWCGKPSCPKLLLLGAATLGLNGRATVAFSAAIEDGKLREADAVGFDLKDKAFGLVGQVVDIAPSLAADLVRAALGGLADWVKALNQQTQVVTLPGGGTSTSFQAGPLWAYALGRVGSILAPPSEAAALVRAVLVGAGEEIQVLTGASLALKAGEAK